MQLLDGLINNYKIIGSFDTTNEKVGISVLELAAKFGMSKPSTPVNTSVKGIIVKRNGKKYTIILAMFNPPIILTWTTPFSITNLNKVIDDISKRNKKIGFISTLRISNSTSELVQIAIG